MSRTPRSISMPIWLVLSSVGLIATPSSAQLGASGNQLWHQDVTGVRDLSEEADWFGNVVATGDFDWDGYDDLAIGIRREEFIGEADVGAVSVLYGGPDGLSAELDDLWHQGLVDLEGAAEAGDEFGFSLAAGDFNDDGYDDLAIGLPFEDIGNIEDAGAVQVLYGSAFGLSPADNQLWYQDSPGVIGDSEEGDWFGYSLAAGDFDDDGFYDLAIGAASEDLGGAENAGAVIILYGGGLGLTGSSSQGWDQGSPGILGEVEDSDFFGSTLTVGDFDHDLYDDLAISADSEAIGDETDAGAVHIIYGTSGGLTAADNQLWHQDIQGILDTAEAFDGFGRRLAAGDFDNDSFDDLAIGSPWESLGTADFAGIVQIIYGSATGLSSGGNQLWSQDSPGVIGGVEPFDHFGDSLAAGDFDMNGFDDLAIGAPGEDFVTTKDGVVHVLYGMASGLSATDSQLWSQDSPGVVGAAEVQDRFGSSLAVGHFDDDFRADLAIGIPREDVGSIFNAGAVQILYAGVAIFSDGFESGNTSAWSATSP